MGLFSARIACGVVRVTIQTMASIMEDKMRGALVARGGRRDRPIRESRELESQYQGLSWVSSMSNLKLQPFGDLSTSVLRIYKCFFSRSWNI